MRAVRHAARACVLLLVWGLTACDDPGPAPAPAPTPEPGADALALGVEARDLGRRQPLGALGEADVEDDHRLHTRRPRQEKI